MTTLSAMQIEYAEQLLWTIRAFEEEILYSDTFIDFNSQYEKEDRLTVLGLLEQSVKEKSGKLS